TDIFGGTPTNIALAFSGPQVDVVCGVNLPMIIKAYSSRNASLHELAALVQEYGKRHIARANELLEPR
ncbi:MAG: PTS sugar transporter subunit IIA, partial [Thermodesulforhabdaceae bacterium]